MTKKSSSKTEPVAAENGASTDVEKPATPSIPEFQGIKDDAFVLRMESTDQLNNLFGTQIREFSNALALHCGNVSGKSEHLDRDKNDALAIVAEIAPQDGLEAMLATQMAATHIAMMRHSTMMANAKTVKNLAVIEGIYNKLARTFTTQMEALRKHRHGGKQTVTVQHVNVSDGGQAIVGHVATDRGVS